MKKETVYTFLSKKEQEARTNKNEHLRKALLDAINECRTWVKLPWADIAEAVTKKVEATEKEAEPLIEKKKSEPLSEAEKARMNEVVALYQIVYHPFLQKIWPTVRRAQVERKAQAERKSGRN
jgi:hypothetical protein